MGTPTRHGFVPRCRGLGTRNWLVVLYFYLHHHSAVQVSCVLISDYTLRGEWSVPYLIISVIYRPGLTGVFPVLCAAMNSLIPPKIYCKSRTGHTSLCLGNSGDGAPLTKQWRPCDPCPPLPISGYTTAWIRRLFWIFWKLLLLFFRNLHFSDVMFRDFR